MNTLILRPPRDWNHLNRPTSNLIVVIVSWNPLHLQKKTGVSILTGDVAAYAYNCHHLVWCTILYLFAHMRSHTVWPIFLVNGSSDMFRIASSTSSSGWKQKSLYIFPLFSQINPENSLFPNCKTFIGNNSVSVEVKAVIYVCSMVFSAMTDRLV